MIKHLILFKNQNKIDIKVDSMVFKFFDKKTSGSGIKNIPSKELVEELQNTIIRKFNKRKVQLPFIDNIWGADLTDMQLNSITELDF